MSTFVVCVLCACLSQVVECVENFQYAIPRLDALPSQKVILGIQPLRNIQYNGCNFLHPVGSFLLKAAEFFAYSYVGELLSLQLEFFACNSSIFCAQWKLCVSKHPNGL